MSEAMIYGASGYTGRLIAAQAVALGMRPVLAGRDADKVRAAAAAHGLSWRSFPLDRPERVRDGLAGVAVVLNAAGPFSATTAPLVDGCFAAGAHYCDITGEIDVFEALAARDGEAASAGLMLLPGVGFDVVPSDGLLAHVSAQVGGATRLRLSLSGAPQVSRGTARTVVAMAHRGTAVRRDGQITWERRLPRGEADFGRGPELTVGVSYGDVSTAGRSTGARDVSAFVRAPHGSAAAARLLGAARVLVGAPPAQALLKRLVDATLPAGPSAERRAGPGMVLVGEAWTASGGYGAARLHTPEPYRTTELTAAAILRRIAAGEARPGFQTPSTAFGADFALTLPGVARHDLPSPPDAAPAAP